MWRTGLLYLDRGDSAIISALRDAGYNTQQTPGSPTRRFSTASSDTEIVWERRVKPDVASPPGIQHWVVPSDGNSLKFSRQRATPDGPLDHLSPASDSTLFEEPPSYSLDQIKEDESSDDYFNTTGLEKSPSFHGDREDSILPQTRRIRHQRAPSSLPPSPSIASTLSSAQRLSRILPARAKTNDGLLQLQADPAKTPQRPSTGHQRRISLGLPIKSALTAIDEPKQLSPPPQYVPPSRPTSSSRKLTTTTALIQKERELEYKHRHTFIGTASLDDFLEVLDVTPTHSTTKAAVVRAFLLLASSERLLARQASLEPSGWGLVARTTSDTVNVDYVEQAHAKLGSIVLRQFLDLIPFNEEDEASAISVMDAFAAASHLDTKASTGNGSKAKAFRSWLVRQAQ
ncbi:hypothetical protein NX059_007071 [Plenodomus lindquistii]|nr:hypothetical protein NX059_007071 [Plenodomus lindquistii]